MRSVEKLINLLTSTLHLIQRLWYTKSIPFIGCRFAVYSMQKSHDFRFSHPQRDTRFQLGAFKCTLTMPTLGLAHFVSHLVDLCITMAFHLSMIHLMTAGKAFWIVLIPVACVRVNVDRCEYRVCRTQCVGISLTKLTNCHCWRTNIVGSTHSTVVFEIVQIVS